MRDKFLLEPTTTAQWKHLVQQAEARAHCNLDDELESYLIFTLIRFTQNPNLASQALAPEFLHGLNKLGQAREQQLRDVGDQCLLLSGLFPQRVEKRLVTIDYYVGMGRAAYDYLGQLMRQALAELYHQLALSFVQLMDVLQNLRHDSQLLPLQALEQWHATGSQHAWRSLEGLTRATPVILDKPVQH